MTLLVLVLTCKKQGIANCRPTAAGLDEERIVKQNRATAYVRTPLCIQSFDTSMLALVNSHPTSGLQVTYILNTFISLLADGLH